MPRAFLPRLGSLVPAIPLALLAAACNPYDPDLGNVPFQCGSADPRCPDGYTCTTTTSFPEGVCVKGSLGVDASTQFICANDGSLEPNDLPNRPFVTTIPSSGPNYSLRGLALCPAGDMDHFQFGVTANGTNLEASVVSVAGRAPLQLNLLTTTGAVIATGISDAATPQMVKLEVSNRLATGSYILQVKSPDMTENNYDLVIKTCATPIPCPD
jgi:hypothetical protein